MENDLEIRETLKTQNFSKIEIEQIINYLQTLEYELNKIRYIGSIFSENERLAKYFF